MMNTTNTAAKYLFVLGGHDAEMLEIARVAEVAGQEVLDLGLGWGPDSEQEPLRGSITAAIMRSSADFVVGVEIGNFPTTSWSGIPCISIDHHGPRSGEKSSLEQVLDLLGLEPNRWQQLITANDVGFIPAMEELGATPEEIQKVRASDRAAQGITEEQEQEAKRAIAEREIFGRLTIVRMEHSKGSTITDPLYGKYDQLLIMSSDGEVNFYGDGQLCSVLNEKFQGWNGGSGLGMEGGSAFWGGYPDHVEVEAFIRQNL